MQGIDDTEHKTADWPRGQGSWLENQIFSLNSANEEEKKKERAVEQSPLLTPMDS